MSEQRIYIAGKEIAHAEEIFPRGIFYGDGVFETMRWKGSPPVFLKRHIDRILYGASVLQIPKPDAGEIIAEIKEAVEKTGFADCAVKICLVSAGRCSPFFAKPDSFQTVVSVRKMFEKPPHKSIKIVCREEPYSRGDSPLRRIKSLNYLENIVAMRDAREKGFDDAFFLGRRGFVAETTYCNIFWGKDRNISTPSLDCGALPGITRSVLAEVGRQNGFAVSEVRCPPEQMAQADFVFVTNSLMGITPVEKVQLQDLTLIFNSANNDSYMDLKNLLYQALMWI